MTEMSLRQNKHGEPVLTIRVTGDAEIFRHAFYMAHGPVEHLGLAMRVFRYLRRRWGISRFKEHDQRITGGKVVERGWHADRGRD
jgi:hypothetical protein